MFTHGMGELCSRSRFSLAEILVLVGTVGAGRTAPPASTRISARLKHVQDSSRVNAMYDSSRVALLTPLPGQSTASFRAGFECKAMAGMQHLLPSIDILKTEIANLWLTGQGCSAMMVNVSEHPVFLLLNRQ